jgi:hypothetical protein
MNTILFVAICQATAFLVFPTALKAMTDAHTLFGIVEDESGSPIPGAEVHYYQLAPMERDPSGKVVRKGLPVQGVIRSGLDGSFEIRDVTEGRYSICPLGKPGETIGSCSWRGSAVRAITENRSTERLRLVLYRTVPIAISVSDAGRLILHPDSDGRISTEGRSFVVGVVSPSGTYIPARLVTSRGDHHSFSVHVPAGQTFRLFFDSGLKVFDDERQLLRRHEVGKRVYRSEQTSGSEVRLHVE